MYGVVEIKLHFQEIEYFSVEVPDTKNPKAPLIGDNAVNGKFVTPDPVNRFV